MTSARIWRFHGIGGAVTGVLTFLASPAVGLWPLAMVALVPSMLAARAASWRVALLEAATAALVMYGVGFGWLASAVHNYFGIDRTLSLGIYAGLVLASAPRSILSLFVFAWLTRRRCSVYLAAPFAFLASELWVPQLVPYSFALALHDTSFAQLAELCGEPGVFLLLVLVNSFVCVALLQRHFTAALRTVAAGACLTGLWLMGGHALYARARALAGRSQPFQVLLVQPSVTSRSKRIAPAAVTRLYQTLSAQALSKGPAQWVAWGETAISAPISDTHLSEVIEQRTGGGFGIPLLTGVAISSDSERRRYNSVIVADAAGRVCASCRFDKTNLVPLAERSPSPWLESSSSSSSNFSAGRVSSTLAINGHPLATAVCYEMLFAELVHARVSPSVELLVSVASNAWQTEPIAISFQRAALQLRAIEYRKYLVHVTTGAESGVIYPDGAATWSAIPAVTLTAGWLRGSTVWQKTGYAFWHVALLAVASGLAIFMAKRGEFARSSKLKAELS